MIGGDSVVAGGDSVVIGIDPKSHKHTAWGVVVVDVVVAATIVAGIVVVDGGATHAPDPVGNSSHTSPPEQHHLFLLG